MMIKDQLKGYFNKERRDKISFALSIVVITGWIVVYSIALAKATSLEKLELNKSIRNVLLLILLMTIVNQVIYVISNLDNLRKQKLPNENEPIDDSKQKNKKISKETVREMSALMGNSLLFISSVLYLISILNSNMPKIGVIQSVLHFVSITFFVVNTVLFLQENIGKLTSSPKNDNDDIQDQHNIDEKINKNKYLKWEIANNSVLLLLMLVGVVYAIDEAMIGELTDNDIKIHNIVKLTIFVMYIAAMTSFAVCSANKDKMVNKKLDEEVVDKTTSNSNREKEVASKIKITKEDSVQPIQDLSSKFV